MPIKQVICNHVNGSARHCYCHEVVFFISYPILNLVNIFSPDCYYTSMRKTSHVYCQFLHTTCWKSYMLSRWNVMVIKVLTIFSLWICQCAGLTFRYNLFLFFFSFFLNCGVVLFLVRCRNAALLKLIPAHIFQCTLQKKNITPCSTFSSNKPYKETSGSSPLYHTEQKAYSHALHICMALPPTKWNMYIMF